MNGGRLIEALPPVLWKQQHASKAARLWMPRWSVSMTRAFRISTPCIAALPYQFAVACAFDRLMVNGDDLRRQPVQRGALSTTGSPHRISESSGGNSGYRWHILRSMRHSLFLYRHAKAVVRIIGTRTTTMCGLGDGSGPVVGRIMRHPHAPEDQPWCAGATAVGL
jgi:hypothetical protein